MLFFNQGLANLLHLIWKDELRQFSLGHNLMEQTAHSLIQHWGTDIGIAVLNRHDSDYFFELLRQHLVLLSSLFGDDRLDDLSKANLVAPYAGLDKTN